MFFSFLKLICKGFFQHNQSSFLGYFFSIHLYFEHNNQPKEDKLIFQLIVLELSQNQMKLFVV